MLTCNPEALGSNLLSAHLKELRHGNFQTILILMVLQLNRCIILDFNIRGRYNLNLERENRPRPFNFDFWRRAETT